MPTVEPQTEALHFFRAMQALVFSIFGTALVVLSVPTLTTNYLWTTFTAIASIFVIVPSALAVRRARSNRPAEPTLYFRGLRRRWALLQLVFAIAVGCSAKFPVAIALHTGHLDLGIAVLYVVGAAIMLRFVPFYFVAFFLLLTALVPFHIAQPAVEFLVAGLLFWLGSFLVFTRPTQ